VLGFISRGVLVANFGDAVGRFEVGGRVVLRGGGR